MGNEKIALSYMTCMDTCIGLCRKVLKDLKNYDHEVLVDAYFRDINNGGRDFNSILELAELIKSFRREQLQEQKYQNNYMLDKLASFLNEYPIQQFNDKREDFPVDETPFYLVAFKRKIETGEDILQEYIYIKNILKNLGTELNDLSYFVQNPYEPNYNYIDKIKEKLEYIVNYKGVWDINSILNHFEFTMKEILAYISELDKYMETIQKEMQENRKENMKQIIEKYYETKRVLSKEDLDKFFKIDFVNNMSPKIDKDIIDSRDINYPLLVCLYKNDELISLHKVIKNIESSLVNYKKSKDFNMYSYIHVNEKNIEDILTEAFVRFNPSQMYSHAITNKNSLYRTLNQIKQRYKDDNRVNLRVIKNVIELYKIPKYNLNNDSVVVDRDLFDECMNKYLHG